MFATKTGGLASLLIAACSCSSIQDQPVRVLRVESGIMIAYNDEGLFFGSPETGANLKNLIRAIGNPRLSSNLGCIDYGFLAWPASSQNIPTHCGEFSTRLIKREANYFVIDLSCGSAGLYCDEGEVGVTKYRLHIDRVGPFRVDVVYRDEVRASYLEAEVS